MRNNNKGYWKKCLMPWKMDSTQIDESSFKKLFFRLVPQIGCFYILSFFYKFFINPLPTSQLFGVGFLMGHLNIILMSKDFRAVDQSFPVRTMRSNKQGVFKKNRWFPYFWYIGFISALGICNYADETNNAFMSFCALFFSAYTSMIIPIFAAWMMLRLYIFETRWDDYK